MPFQKGHKKTGGRKAGSNNKISINLRESITNFLEENIDAVFEDFKNLEAKDRVNTAIKLLEFTTPRLKSIDIESNEREYTNIDPFREIRKNLGMTDKEGSIDFPAVGSKNTDKNINYEV